jgi:acyl-coenzyme A synthetase/AMP-(fatty) acid ligase
MNRLPLTTRPLASVIAWRGAEAVTVGRFLAEAALLAKRLPASGHAINLCRDRYRFARAFAAALLAHQTNLLPGNRLDGTIRDLLTRYPDAYVLGDEPQDTHWPASCSARLGEETAGIEPAAAPTLPAAHLAAIVFTSGSTGRPKAIHKPWYSYHDSSLINAAEMGLTTEPVHQLVATVPPQHMYGLETSVLIPWFAPVAASRARPFLPADIARELAALPAPRILITTPAHLRALADPSVELPLVETVWSATGPLDPAIAADIETRHHTRVREIYGCSEMGSMARRDPVHDDIWTLFRGFDLQAESGGTRAAAKHLPDACLLQDRIEFVGAGRFRVTGRLEDLVNVAGKRASLVELNQALLQVPGVEDGVIFEPPARIDGRTERLAALVVAPGLDADRLRDQLRARIDEAFLPRPVRWIDALPRAETGKLPRKAILEAFAAADARED